MVAQQKASASGRKIGRNARYCEVYRKLNTRLKNQIKKLKRHLNRKKGSVRNGTQVLRHKNDKVAMAALARLS